ncbi:hypothetical protein Tco_1019623 [Tanacetum coccineum]|uniref:No apical meristem-associated C-terminal domain-containing protein n=1 Tax=Tanacetum coccineum TaxID=301880 RepID=A0ABQ5FXP3_9ASTR
MLNDPNNQIPGSSSNPNNNPGSSTQPSYNQMPYYPKFQTPFANPKELSLFNQWKMQNQFSQFQLHHHQQQQQQPNQATVFQPQSDQQSFHLVDETEDKNEEEPIPTPTSKKTSRGPRLKLKATKNKEKETQVEVKKRARMVWSQDEELILTESFIQIFEDPKTGCGQQKDTFLYKILEVYNVEAKRRGYMKRTMNMLTGKWTPLNASVQKFNQLVSKTLAHSGENDEDWMTRVEILYKTHTGCDFKHKSAWLFLKGKHKWKNPESTNARRNRFRVTDEEPEHFGDDVLPRPPGLQRIAKSQRSGSNSTASSGSNPMMYQEFMKEQYELDRKAKMQVIEQESEERRQLIHSQRIAEDMKVLQIDTRGMDPADAVIINAQKARIRAAYPPPPN